MKPGEAGSGVWASEATKCGGSIILSSRFVQLSWIVALKVASLRNGSGDQERKLMNGEIFA
jgi:hypothetical protein